MDQNERIELIQKVLHLQMQAQRFMRDESPDAFLSINLSIAQLKSLFYINFEGETNLRKLATALGASPPNVTGIVDRLVEHGIVSREYNPANRREQVIKLTAQGTEIINGLRARISQHMTSVLERLEIRDLAALAQGLEAMTRAAQEQVAFKAQTTD